MLGSLYGSGVGMNCTLYKNGLVIPLCLHQMQLRNWIRGQIWIPFFSNGAICNGVKSFSLLGCSSSSPSASLPFLWNMKYWLCPITMCLLCVQALSWTIFFRLTWYAPSKARDDSNIHSLNYSAPLSCKQLETKHPLNCPLEKYAWPGVCHSKPLNW